MRVLLIHDADELRLRLVHMLADAMPEAAIELIDPARQGMPGDAYAWDRIDVVILDERPANEDGIAWLAARAAERSLPPLPPVVVLTSTGAADRATAAGAAQVLPKARLAPATLAQVLRGIPPAASAPGATSPDLPFEIPGYRLVRPIEQGGMARIYLAHREGDDQALVLKILDPALHADPLFRERFRREYRILERIDHPHVVRILDQGMTDTFAFIAMEYLAHGDLKSRIEPQGMPPGEAIGCLRQIALALDAVHSAGVIHRDLKPQNIMFREPDHLVLLDFGLARELNGSSTLTQRGIVFATPLYMSPEQCLGAPLDASSDLYSAGVLFYEMLTGRPPFLADRAPELANQHVHAPVPELPAGLRALQPLVERLLAKRPADRFGSARALLEALP